MAKKKLRKFATGRIKWYLLYALFVLISIFSLVATIIFLDNGTDKILAIIYESFVILTAVGFPIAVEVYWRKDSKKEKNCDIHAK